MSVWSQAGKRERTVIVLFWAQLAAFALMVGGVLFPFLQRVIRFAFSPLMGVCFVLGLLLWILGLRARVGTLLRRFLVLAGVSSAGFVVSSVLHNAFYALATVTEDLPIVHGMANGLEVGFFIIAIIACPIGWIVGSVGAIVILVRRRRDEPQ